MYYFKKQKHFSTLKEMKNIALFLFVKFTLNIYEHKT